MKYFHVPTNILCSYIGAETQTKNKKTSIQEIWKKTSRS